MLLSRVNTYTTRLQNGSASQIIRICVVLLTSSLSLYVCYPFELIYVGIRILIALINGYLCQMKIILDTTKERRTILCCRIYCISVCVWYPCVITNPLYETDSLKSVTSKKLVWTHAEYDFGSKCTLHRATFSAHAYTHDAVTQSIISIRTLWSSSFKHCHCYCPSHICYHRSPA